MLGVIQTMESRSVVMASPFSSSQMTTEVGSPLIEYLINTLDTDNQFRLVVMVGVTQDEVRKLSERLKFGFRQSIKNGHMLGNDRLWGYDKRDCKLTVNLEQAWAVRLIFELYATGRYGVRSPSRELTAWGLQQPGGHPLQPDHHPPCAHQP